MQPPELVRVGAEEAVVQRAAEARSDPVLEARVSMRSNPTPASSRGEPRQRVHILAEAEVAEEIDRLQRIAKAAAVVEHHTAPLLFQKVIAKKPFDPAGELGVGRHETMTAEVETPSVALVCRTQTAHEALPLEHDRLLAPPRQVPCRR